MTVAADSSRQEKVNWLTRPLFWAWRCCFVLLVCPGFVWWQGQIDDRTAITWALAGLSVVLVLLTWGIRRVTFTAHGRL